MKVNGTIPMGTCSHEQALGAVPTRLLPFLWMWRSLSVHVGTRKMVNYAARRRNLLNASIPREVKVPKGSGDRGSS